MATCSNTTVRGLVEAVLPKGKVEVVLPQGKVDFDLPRGCAVIDETDMIRQTIISDNAWTIIMDTNGVMVSDLGS